MRIHLQTSVQPDNQMTLIVPKYESEHAIHMSSRKKCNARNKMAVHMLNIAFKHISEMYKQT